MIDKLFKGNHKYYSVVAFLFILTSGLFFISPNKESYVRQEVRVEEGTAELIGRYKTSMMPYQNLSVFKTEDGKLFHVDHIEMYDNPRMIYGVKIEYVYREYINLYFDDKNSNGEYELIKTEIIDYTYDIRIIDDDNNMINII